MGFLRLNVVLTGDVILIKTHAPVPTHTHTRLTHHHVQIEQWKNTLGRIFRGFAHPGTMTCFIPYLLFICP